MAAKLRAGHPGGDQPAGPPEDPAPAFDPTAPAGPAGDLLRGVHSVLGDGVLGELREGQADQDHGHPDEEEGPGEVPVVGGGEEPGDERPDAEGRVGVDPHREDLAHRDVEEGIREARQQVGGDPRDGVRDVEMPEHPQLAQAVVLPHLEEVLRDRLEALVGPNPDVPGDGIEDEEVHRHLDPRRASDPAHEDHQYDGEEGEDRDGLQNVHHGDEGAFEAPAPDAQIGESPPAEDRQPDEQPDPAHRDESGQGDEPKVHSPPLRP